MVEHIPLRPNLLTYRTVPDPYKFPGTRLHKMNVIYLYCPSLEREPP